MSEKSSKISLYGLIMIAIGSCIGIGIFTTPNVVTKHFPHANFILIIWLLGGVISMFGAVTFAELGSRFPKSGGVYVYLKEAYGELTGFLYGWVILMVITTGALAALSVAAIDFLGFFFEFSEVMKTVLAAVLIVVLTLINTLGVKISEYLASLFTGAKLLAIIAIIILAIALSTQLEMQEAIDIQTSIIPDNLFTAFFLSLVGVFWSFGGWHHTSYLSEESVNPRRNIPLAMIIGVAVVTLVYVLVNYAYMQALPLSAIASSDRVAGDAMEALIPGGGKYLTIMVLISITGTIAIYTMSAPRIYFAMARDGVFFKGLGKIHPVYKTPVNAMLLQAFWAVILIFVMKKFHVLMTFVTFMDILFMMMAAFSIFIFRHVKKLEKPSVVAWGYPILPALYVIITAVFVVNTAWHLPRESWFGLILLAAGVPIFMIFRSRRNSR